MTYQRDGAVNAPVFFHPFVAWARNSRYVSRLNYHRATVHSLHGDGARTHHCVYYTWDALLDCSVIYDSLTERFYDVVAGWPLDKCDSYATIEELIAAIEAETKEDELP